MKCFFITASMVGGGTERVISILANHFARLGDDVTILMTADDRLDYTLEETVKCELITTTTGKSIKKRFERIEKLRKIYLANKDAVFYSFGTETNLFAILAAIGTKANLILSERSDPNQCTFKLLRNTVYSFGKRFVFQTEQAAKCFSKKIQMRGMVISNPLREDIPDSFCGERTKTIVSVGRLIPLKNYPMLLQAFAEFCKEYSEYKLEIYGQGTELERLKALVCELEIEGKVQFKGFSENVLKEIANAGMYVICSDYEGVSNALLEAMALGLPVIATDCPIGGAASLIENEVNGLLVPVGNKEKLYEAMTQYASDVALSSRCGENAMKVRIINGTEYIAEQWRQYGY